MDRRGFLKTLLGGLAVATVAPSLVKAEPAKFQVYYPPKTDLPIAWGGTIAMIPDSSNPLIYDHYHRFPDSWVYPLQVVDTPTFGNIQMTTRKTKLTLSLEVLQDMRVLGDEIDKYIVEQVMVELREHNYKYFHSILLVRIIEPQSFRPMANVLVRGA